MANITQQKLQELIKGAPQGITPDMIIQGLQAKGHSLPGSQPTTLGGLAQPKVSLFSPQQGLSFLPRVGQRLLERRKNVEQILSPRFGEGASPTENIPGQQAFGVVTQGAGLAADIGGEIFRSVIGTLGKLVPEDAPVRKVFNKLGSAAVTGLDKAGVTEFLKAHEEAKQISPEYARKATAIEGVLNLGALALEFEGVGVGSKLATRGAKVGGEIAGELAGRAATKLEGAAVKQAEADLVEYIRPLLSKSERAEAIGKGRGVSQTKFGGTKIAPSRQDIEVAGAVRGLVDPQRTHVENIAAIRKDIASSSEGIRGALRRNDSIYNESQLRKRLSDAKEESRVVFGSDKTKEAAYDAIADEFVKQLGSRPKNISNLYEARIEFDRFIESKFPNAFGEVGDNARNNAIRDIRRAANDFIAERLPEGDALKGVLRRQTLMFEAVDNLKFKAAADPKGPLVRALKVIQDNPVSSATLAATGIGAITGLLSNPAAIATLVATGAVKLGKKVYTSQALKESLSKFLRGIEKVAPEAVSGDKAIVEGALKYLDNPKLGLGIEDVKK